MYEAYIYPIARVRGNYYPYITHLVDIPTPSFNCHY